MEQNPKTTKQGLTLTVALLASCAVLATPYLSQDANAAPKKFVAYYRTAAYWQNHAPYEVGYTDYGIYRQFVLPDGTMTGPIPPDANGG